jgi:hypothetical protein
MDGRPHPSPNALQTWQGFSAGAWTTEMFVEAVFTSLGG